MAEEHKKDTLYYCNKYSQSATNTLARADNLSWFECEDLRDNQVFLVFILGSK